MHALVNIVTDFHSNMLCWTCFYYGQGTPKLSWCSLVTHQDLGCIQCSSGGGLDLLPLIPSKAPVIPMEFLSSVVPCGLEVGLGYGRSLLSWSCHFLGPICPIPPLSCPKLPCLQNTIPQPSPTTNPCHPTQPNLCQTVLLLNAVLAGCCRLQWWQCQLMTCFTACLQHLKQAQGWLCQLMGKFGLCYPLLTVLSSTLKRQLNMEGRIKEETRWDYEMTSNCTTST